MAGTEQSVCRCRVCKNSREESSDERLGWKKELESSDEETSRPPACLSLRADERKLSEEVLSNSKKRRRKAAP